MNVVSIEGWRQPGCGPTCWPRQHDPDAHELHGFLLALKTPPDRIIRTGPITVDVEAARVTVDTREVWLSGRELALLLTLSGRIGRWCSHEDLILGVFGPSWVVGEITISDRNHLRNVVARLRAKLGEAGRLIVTSPANRGGYRLNLVEATP